MGTLLGNNSKEQKTDNSMITILTLTNNKHSTKQKSAYDG